MDSLPRKLYVQVTLNCNQRCPHCCYGCGPEHREFMSIETFRAAIAREPQAYLNIGGGEPTCHPRFWEFMHEAISTRERGRIWISTNGKRKGHALRLAELAAEGTIVARVSIDRFHEPVDPEVERAFRGLPAQARYNMARPIAAGRWEGHDGRKACNCASGVFVQWDGKVRQCGCLGAPAIGDVFGGYRPMFDGEDAWGCAFGLDDPNRRKR